MAVKFRKQAIKFLQRANSEEVANGKVFIGFGLAKIGLYSQCGLIRVRLKFIRLGLGEMFIISNLFIHQSQYQTH
jgi:hypothetical protein